MGVRRAAWPPRFVRICEKFLLIMKALGMILYPGMVLIVFFLYFLAPWAGIPGIETHFYGGRKARNNRQDEQQSGHDPSFAGHDHEQRTQRTRKHERCGAQCDHSVRSHQAANRDKEKDRAPEYGAR